MVLIVMILMSNNGSYCHDDFETVIDICRYPHLVLQAHKTVSGKSGSGEAQVACFQHSTHIVMHVAHPAENAD